LIKTLRHALLLSLFVNTFGVLADLVAAPLHAAGHAQTLLGYVIGAGHILGMIGFAAADWTGFHPGHTWTWRGFGVGLIVNLIFWMVVGLVWGNIRRRLKVARNQTRFIRSAEPASPNNVPRFSRRHLILGSGRAMAGVGLGVGGYGFFAEARWFEITSHEVPIKGLSPALDHLRIVQISDLHHGSWMSIGWVRQIIDVANSLMPDVVALTGDFVYRGHQYVRPVAKEFTRLKARCAVLGVMGNHDWWEGGGELTRRVFAEEGLQLIDNARRFLTPLGTLTDAPQRDALCIAGVGDLWEDKCLYDKALAGVPGGMPRLLLSHNPDVAEEPDFLRSGHRCDLILSGHTHGGQIRLPGIGAPVTNSAHGTKYAQGLVQGPVCPVYISRGLGMTVMPLRIGVRPEIAVIELVSA
jgi:predicted MPP superfamily phosphohydrolase